VNVLYVLVALLALVDTRRERQVRGWAVLLAMSVVGVAVSALLFYIAHFLIRSLCPFCMGIYVLNVAIAATTVLHVVRRRRSIPELFLADVRAFLVKPPLAILAAPALMLALAYVLYPRIYDTGACPGEKDEDLCTEPSTYGNPSARVKIVEYSDYECPFCGMTHFNLRKAVETYPGDVALVHVNFPLDMACNDLLDQPFHDSACEAARASVCAQRQGRFWEYNDYLFTHQRQIGRIPHLRIAKSLGLDTDAFEACMSDPTSLADVKADIEKAKKTEFVRNGQIGTPIIMINGKGHMGAIHWEDLDRYLTQSFGLAPHEEAPR
jgi:protein-disulfide isomerase